MTSFISSDSVYLERILAATPFFVESLVTSLRQKYNLDITSYGESGAALEIDHICYRTETMEEYKAIQEDFKNNPSKIRLLVESIIGGRPISVYEFLQPLPISITISDYGTKRKVYDGNLDSNDETDRGQGGHIYRTMIRCLELPSPKFDKNGQAK